jgi:hypothetical protein
MDMKKYVSRLLAFATLLLVINVTSCKSKSKDNNASTTISSDSSATPSQVSISNDEVLKKGVMDATKDYPTVKADVADSVINLTGEIKRADWQRLNPTLNSLHPKRVNSANLTIK